MTEFDFAPDDLFEFDDAALEPAAGPEITEPVVVTEFWFTELHSTTVPEAGELAVNLSLPDPFQAAASGAGMIGAWFARRRAARGGTLGHDLPTPPTKAT